MTRESWRLTDDPRVEPPRAELMMSGNTASEAADFARKMAEAYDRHGFHKSSSSWWGADQTHFHRFVVHAGRKGRGGALVIASGLIGLAAILVASRGRSARRRRLGSSRRAE